MVNDNDVRPFHFTQRQPFAEVTARRSIREPLYAFGEYAFFVLLWHAVDFEQGLVRRCPVCYGASGRIAAAYDQGDKAKCKGCFGTTFEGGFRAKIIRPALFTDRVTDTIEGQRGENTTDQVTIETTSDFALRHGDWVVRQGNLRYQTEEKSVVVIRSGFGEPQDVDSMGGAVSSARLEDRKSSPAYLVPPVATAELDAILSRPVGEHLPPDLSAFEVVRGVLIV